MVDDQGAVSNSQTFTITVTAVNDAPVYTRNSLSPISSLEDESLVNISVDLINTFATAPATALDEVGNQSAIWTTSNYTRTSGNLVFDVLQIKPDGTLEYRPRKDTAGTATLTINLQDDGLGGSPHDNTATLLTISINIVEDNDALRGRVAKL
ncbi:MAG: Ig-like domain-containing protein [Planctomycetaceae bacterium]